MKIGGAVLAYTATAGTMLITNDKDEPIALFGFTAYVKDGADPRTRPIDVRVQRRSGLGVRLAAHGYPRPEAHGAG